jgi:hypothetical protein
MIICQLLYSVCRGKKVKKVNSSNKKGRHKNAPRVNTHTENSSPNPAGWLSPNFILFYYLYYSSKWGRRGFIILVHVQAVIPVQNQVKIFKNQSKRKQDTLSHLPNRR